MARRFRIVGGRTPQSLNTQIEKLQADNPRDFHVGDVAVTWEQAAKLSPTQSEPLFAVTCSWEDGNIPWQE